LSSSHSTYHVRLCGESIISMCMPASDTIQNNRCLQIFELLAEVPSLEDSSIGVVQEHLNMFNFKQCK
jgi:hypothetical protein